MFDLQSDHFPGSVEIEVALDLLELTRQDIASIGHTENRFVDLLREYSEYSNSSDSNQTARLKVNYAESSDPHLMRLREQYNLDAIAGKDPEIDQLRNLTHWVHGLAIHTSSVSVPAQMNSLNLLHIIHTEGMRINCGMYATILNDVYLSMGWKSRIVHLKPYNKNYLESHVVNAVYCQQLEKWLYFDPNLNAYFMDEAGKILSVAEVRQRLIDGAVLQVNDGLAFNSDNQVFATLGRQFGKDFYRLYIAKNIFRYDCPQSNMFDDGSRLGSKVKIELLPDGYHPGLLAQPQRTAKNDQIIYTTNMMHFWQRP
jgi:hypothetical protein